MYRIQIRRTDKPKPWYWRIVAKNGQVVLTSESYASKRNARRAAETFAWDSDLNFDIEEE